MKKFNVGLNLDAPLDRLETVFREYSNRITSIYFSPPVGEAFYSRRRLVKEYEENQDKIPAIVELLKENDIRSEVTFNTKVTRAEFDTAIRYLNRNNIVPDEFVCLNQYFDALKEAFPNAEFISSYCNGTKDVLSGFDSVVLGQSFLRDKEKRKQFLNKGMKLILLLNNGCSFQCNPARCDSKTCPVLYSASLKKYDSNYIYALQSFFPEELRELMDEDENSAGYRYKISNRTLGLDYTINVLNAYDQMTGSAKGDFLANPERYMYFGALYQLCKNISQYDYEKIISDKFEINPNLRKYFSIDG
jgi:hypothetical protein